MQKFGAETFSLKKNRRPRRLKMNGTSSQPYQVTGFGTSKAECLLEWIDMTRTYNFGGKNRLAKGHLDYMGNGM
jgi:hypothetical protein